MRHPAAPAFSSSHSSRDSAPSLGAPPPRRSPLQTALRGAGVLAALAVLVSTWGPLGCGGTASTGTTGTTGGTGGASAASSSSSSSSAGTGTSSGAFCEGGFVRMVNGQPTCEGLCKPALCKNKGNVCVDNDCALKCTTHLECALGQDCAPATEDGTAAKIMTCQSNGKGAFGTKCPNGTECADVKACGDGAACPMTGSCAKGACASLACAGTGMGDADAYCTMHDCQTDADCPGGYACDTVRDPHQICGKPVPNKNVCGSTKEPCVDPSKNAANGTTYAAGPYCTMRNECRIRTQCDPCAGDVDCSLVAGRRCVQGECLFQCGSDADCVNGYQCTGGACVPRSGSCAPAMPGKAKFCDDCRTQADCGPGLMCGQIEPGSQRFCFDEAFNACASDADCPVAASGKHAICADDRLGFAAGDQGYHTCYVAPYNTATGKFVCWCGNPTTGCFTGDDCCSKVCMGADVANQVAGTCQ